MKKFFAIAFVAASLVACNSGGEKKPAEDTAAKAPADTMTTAPLDTAAKLIDSAAKMIDTAAKKIEEIKK